MWEFKNCATLFHMLPLFFCINQYFGISRHVTSVTATTPVVIYVFADAENSRLVQETTLKNYVDNNFVRIIRL